MIIRGSQGLGDAIYLWPVVKYYSERGKDVTIITRYPEVYSNLKCTAIQESEFVDCQCSARTKELDTNIYEDTLLLSGITEKIPFEFEFKKVFIPVINTSKRICVVRLPSAPVKGGEETAIMIPKPEVYQNIINAFKDRVYFVSVGKQIECEHKLSGIDLDLSNTETLNDYFSVLSCADIIMTQPGHCVPIAEALGKKLFCIFASAGLISDVKRYRFTTPQKILTRSESAFCQDGDLEKVYLDKFERLLLQCS
jgi:hypothetical protein